MGKKGKVLPAEDAANLSSEEKEQARKNALVKETAKFLNEGHMRKLCRAYHVTSAPPSQGQLILYGGADTGTFLFFLHSDCRNLIAFCSLVG